MTLFLKIIALIIAICSMVGYGYYGVLPMLLKTKLNKQTTHKYNIISAICLLVFLIEMILISFVYK